MTLYTNRVLRAIWSQAAAAPDRVALQEPDGGAITFGALARQVDTLAGNLRRHGFQPGDRVLLLVRPSVRAILLALTALRAGGVLVIGDIGMGREVFASRMRLVAPRWVFAETLLLALQQSAFLRRRLKGRGVEIPEITGLAPARIVNIGPRLPGLLRADLAWADLQRALPVPVGADQEVDPGADALIVFTSGTTALPKGVVHTHGGIAAALDLMLGCLPPTPGDVYYGSALHIIVPALCSGAPTVLPRAALSPSATLRCLARYRVTKTFAIPAEYEPLVSLCAQTGTPLPASLDTILFGAAPIPAAFLERLAAVVAPHTQVLVAYGMTEILPICVVSLAEKLAYTAPGDLVGRPLPGVSLSLAPDGELRVGGPHLFDRYLDGPPVREHATGDLATMDPQGRVILIGRKKDMIIRGHHNLYPTLIESTIRQVPGVRNCALIGVYDPVRSDEAVVLVVEKADPRDEATFRRYLTAELLTGPHSIDQEAQPDRIVFAPLPTAGRSQKVDKQKLRALLRRQDVGGRT
jgi:acyl-CoA synthetase (AMP-forming)/AMP-acid ligase II